MKEGNGKVKNVGAKVSFRSWGRFFEKRGIAKKTSPPPVTGV